MPSKNAPSLVTGGGGFIGSHLCEALLRGGHEVIVVDHFMQSNRVNIESISDRVEIVQMDIRSRKFADLITSRDFETIFHLAGSASVPMSVQEPWEDFQNNTVGGLRMLESLRIKSADTKVIAMSSAAVYGQPSQIPISEEHSTFPISPYGAAKLAIERYVSVYCKIYGLKAASLRAFSAYGPRLRTQVVFDFIRKLRNSPGKLQIVGDGSQIRDFIFVEDVVQAILVVAEQAPMDGEVYNVASGIGVSTLELANHVSKRMGLSPKISFTGGVGEGVPDRWIAAIDRLSELGFENRYTLDEGIDRTVEWVLEHS